MRKILLVTTALMASATGALAGGVERSTQSTSILFEEGNRLQFSFRNVNPSLTGTFAGTVASGDMAPDYSSVNMGLKLEVSPKLDFAFIIDQSNGADVAYPAGTPYPFAGVNANLDITDYTALLRYSVNERVSVFGGLRMQQLSAGLTGLPVPSAGAVYDLGVDTSQELGYVLGAAYEIPDIALRVALTYNSAIDHDLTSTETFTTGGGVSTIPGGFTTTLPQSMNLEFQTGIAEGTLLFGSVRWVDWSEFDISPPSLTAPLIDYQSDYITYNLGIGRRFNENWAGAITVGYEPSTGDVQGNLAPRDGYESIGVGVSYTQGNVEVSGGVSYIRLGDATTQTIGASFTDNEAFAFGMQVGLAF